MGFLALGDYTLTRLLVLAASIALIVLSCIGLSQGGSVGHYVVNAVILAVSLLGFFGTLQTDIVWLRMFMFLLAALCIWEFIYILVSVFKYGSSAGAMVWDIVLCVLTGVTACFVAGLIEYSGTGWWGTKGSWTGRSLTGGPSYATTRTVV